MDTSEAELVFDVDAAMDAGTYDDELGTEVFVFRAYGENEPGYSSQDSGFRIYVQNDQDYGSNPACP